MPHAARPSDGVKTIYLDACCVGRPFDDQTQFRIRLEAEAVVAIVDRCQKGDWCWVASKVLEFEVAQIPDEEERWQQQAFARMANVVVPRGRPERQAELEALGFRGLDAAHLACAENAKVEVFLTTDDRLLRRAVRLADRLGVRVDNPLDWLQSFEDEERLSHDPDA